MKRLHIEYGFYVRAHSYAPLHSSVRTPLRSRKEEKSHCCCDSVTVILMEILSAPSVEFRENNILISRSGPRPTSGRFAEVRPGVGPWPPFLNMAIHIESD
jgi:hypothetical protein